MKRGQPVYSGCEYIYADKNAANRQCHNFIERHRIINRK